MVLALSLRKVLFDSCFDLNSRSLTSGITAKASKNQTTLYANNKYTETQGSKEVARSSTLDRVTHPTLGTPFLTGSVSKEEDLLSFLFTLHTHTWCLACMFLSRCIDIDQGFKDFANLTLTSRRLPL